jgi:hypothetical protein
MKTNFFRLVDNERRKRAMTFPVFCRHIGVNQTTLTYWKNHSDPRLGEAIRILRKLGVPLAALSEGGDNGKTKRTYITQTDSNSNSDSSNASVVGPDCVPDVHLADGCPSGRLPSGGKS